MKILKSKSLAVAAATLGVAALLGGSLGVVMASTRSQSLSAGFNLAGGPLNGDVAPDQFVGCLPASSWRAVYIWDSATQTWEHFFNTSAGVPAYVNSAGTGGITAVPRFSGVVLIMNQAVGSPQLKDSNAESCTS
jgi:hypothetical protein